MPAINLTDDELAAVTAAIRRMIEDDRFPHAPRLDSLRAALGKFDAASEPTPLPKAPPPAKTSALGERLEPMIKIAIAQAAFEAGDGQEVNFQCVLS